MAEYIERELAIQAVVDTPCRMAIDKGKVIRAVEGVPLADVVEVVRCKDCKHAEKIREEEKTIYKKDAVVCGRCFTINDKRPGDWYCPEGAKRDGKGEGDG